MFAMFGYFFGFLFKHLWGACKLVVKFLFFSFLQIFHFLPHPYAEILAGFATFMIYFTIFWFWFESRKNPFAWY